MSDNITTKEKQDELLEILKNVMDVCEKNNIKYMGFGGTCLGAVRHKGFIPWDDDIDILMPRKEYEKFKLIANQQLPSKYKFYPPEELGYGTTGSGRVFDEETTLIHKARYKTGSYRCGFCSDIMPLDGVPNNLCFRKIVARLNYLTFLCGFIRNRKLRSIKHIYSYFLFFLSLPLKVLLKIFTSGGTSAKVHEKLYKKYDFEKYDTVSFSWSKRGSFKFFPSSLFRETQLLPFEDIMIPCPKDYDTYLKIHYGNYLELPPENERRTHPAYVCSLTHSYKNYNPKTGKFDKDIEK